MNTFKASKLQKRLVVAAIGGAAVIAGSAALLLHNTQEAQVSKAGVTGLKTAPGVAAMPIKPGKSAISSSNLVDRTSQEALASYSKGDYTAARAKATQIISAVHAVPHPAISERQTALQARHLIAFAAARQKDLKTARVQFALLKKEATELPEHKKSVVVPPGADPAPTIEEDAAYQHAVCTAALGDKMGAEKEYVAFMKAYPDSPLLQAAVKRIARLHGGDIPKEDEAIWRQAMDIAQAHEKQRQRDVSMCGPECLSELLRRRGETVSVASLADEMHTSDQGTSLEALAVSAKQHGWDQARGLALTPKGLAQQTLPLVALVAPRHFVLVDTVTSDRITVWDPDAEGVGKSARRAYSAMEWQRLWRGGIALALK